MKLSTFFREELKTKIGLRLAILNPKSAPNFFLGAKLINNLAHLILLLQDICAVAQNFAKFVLISKSMPHRELNGKTSSIFS